MPRRWSVICDGVLEAWVSEGAYGVVWACLPLKEPVSKDLPLCGCSSRCVGN